MDNQEWLQMALKHRNLDELYRAKCADLKIGNDENQLKLFCTHIVSKAKNRSLDLSNCYLKEQSAKVLATKFMMQNQHVAKYDLSFNEIGDNGVSVIA